MLDAMTVVVTDGYSSSRSTKRRLFNRHAFEPLPAAVLRAGGVRAPRPS
jgi:hypothetical protein